jgi:chromosome segregation ATPase
MSRLLVTLIALIAWPAFADVYKWVDENGKVQYSDKPPQTQAKKGVTELNKQGMTIRQTEGVLTAEERAAKDAEAAKSREEQAKVQDQRRRDRALLNSYSNTAEIDEVRDRNVEALQATVTSDQSRHDAMQKRLDEYNKQANQFKTAKKPVPADLASAIADRQAELEKIDARITAKQQEIDQTKQHAEEDKKRLVELRGTDAKR